MGAQDSHLDFHTALELCYNLGTGNMIKSDQTPSAHLPVKFKLIQIKYMESGLDLVCTAIVDH